MSEIAIDRIRKRDLPRAMELLLTAFGEELAGRGSDLRSLERLVRCLLACRRLPVWILRQTGEVAELWVARSRGRPVGVLGQMGRSAPYMSGIAVDPAFRGRGVAQALFRQVFTDLSARRIPFVRGAVLADNSPALRLCAKCGLVPYARTSLQEIPLPATLPPPTAGIAVRPARPGDRRRLWPTSYDESGLRRLLAMEGGFEASPLRLLGAWSRAWVAERDGAVVGYLGMQANRYQAAGTIRTPCLIAEEAYFPLLRAALQELERLGRRKALVDLLDSQHALAAGLAKLGACPDRSWVHLVRYLP
ncbi:MAG: GNAT family N-acetyltransferase [Candidatus Bipolaricaulaceae bacterium]